MRFKDGYEMDLNLNKLTVSTVDRISMTKEAELHMISTRTGE